MNSNTPSHQCFLPSKRPSISQAKGTHGPTSNMPSRRRSGTDLKMLPSYHHLMPAGERDSPNKGPPSSMSIARKRILDEWLDDGLRCGWIRAGQRELNNLRKSPWCPRLRSTNGTMLARVSRVADRLFAIDPNMLPVSALEACHAYAATMDGPLAHYTRRSLLLGNNNSNIRSVDSPANLHPSGPPRRRHHLPGQVRSGKDCRLRSRHASASRARQWGSLGDRHVPHS